MNGPTGREMDRGVDRGPVLLSGPDASPQWHLPVPEMRCRGDLRHAQGG
jgi:hypothetical protein